MPQKPDASSTRTTPPLSRILIVDDDEAVARLIARMVSHVGHETVTAHSGEDALRVISENAIDLVISDVQMPAMDGIQMLEELRRRQLDLPVVFLTGLPSVQTAAKAVEYGAFRYLTKPVDQGELRRAIEDAARARSLTRARDPLGMRAALEKEFLAALESMWMAFQPILSADTKVVIGYEALLRSREPSLPHPGAVIDAAEKLGAVHVLGRRTRSLVADVIAREKSRSTFFVNVHSADLADADLYSSEAPLSDHARRVVIEITERATLEGVRDLEGRIRELRALGYRIAVDDLGAGYAGLSYFASIQPEIVKIDMSLVRGIDADSVKQRVVLSMASLSRQLGIEVVAEGVETGGERDLLVRLGCTHLQGFLFAKPAPPFPQATWGPMHP